MNGTPRRIRISSAGIDLEAVLNDTKTAEAIWNALPIEGSVMRWGDEIYFGVPVTLGGEQGREQVAVGDLGYWPPGRAFCIFFGPTPASTDREPRAASPVNVFGHVGGDATRLRAVEDGARIRIERTHL